MAGNFLTSWVTVSFWRRTLFHGVSSNGYSNLAEASCNRAFRHVMTYTLRIAKLCHCACLLVACPHTASFTSQRKATKVKTLFINSSIIHTNKLKSQATVPCYSHLSVASSTTLYYKPPLRSFDASLLLPSNYRLLWLYCCFACCETFK
jgi:hypothetical protein